MGRLEFKTWRSLYTIMDTALVYFEGAGGLLRDAISHGLSIAKSDYMFEYVKNGFLTGNVPPPGIVCDTDMRPYATADLEA